jgi:uncharacterized protein
MIWTVILNVLLSWPSPVQQATVLSPAQDANKPQPHTPSDISQLRVKADSGDPDAENDLGVRYRMGEGVEKDKEEAVRWYRKAAKHGSAAAMFNLGAAYYNGDGVGVDDVVSCAWFLLAEEAGHPGADEAVRRATSESASRPIVAAEKVGEMYEKGEELSKNAGNALKWYRRAADSGSPQASLNAAALLANAPNPTQENLEEARKRCEDAAKSDYGPAAFCMATIYKRGLGVAQDAAESAKWLIRAANDGHPKAMLQLGEAYWKGDGVKPNLITAYVWIWMAYRLKVSGAEQDEETLRNQMNAKDVEKARKNAETWPVRGRVLVVQKH